MLAIYIHRGAEYCNKIALAAVPQASAGTKGRVHAGKAEHHEGHAPPK